MIIERKFAPIKLTIETNEELAFLKEIANIALRYECSGIGGRILSRSKSNIAYRIEAFLRDIE